MTIENERFGGETGTVRAENSGEEILDSSVCRAKMSSKQPNLFPVFLDEGTAQAKCGVFGLIAYRWQPQGCQFEVGVVYELFVLLGLRGVTLANAKRFLLIV